MNLNQGISTPIAILIVVICAALVGVIVWQYKGVKETKTSEIETAEEINESKETIEISTLEDAKRAVDEIDWELPWSYRYTYHEEGVEKEKTRRVLIGGPYYYKEGKDDSTGDPFVVWKASRYSSNKGETWQEISFEDQSRFSIVLIFIEKGSPIAIPELGVISRCETYRREGKEYMYLVFGGVGSMEYYKTVAGRKIFAEGEPEVEGYWFGWCNSQKSIQILGVSESTEFIDAVINKYFQTSGE